MVKLILKRILFYNVIYVAATILLVMISGDGFELYMEWLSILLGLVILIDIGRSIKSKGARKKYIIYTGIIVFTMALFVVLGNIFGFKTYVSSETENTVWDMLSVSVIFSVIIGIFIKIIIDSGKKYPLVKLLYFPVFVWGLGAIIMWATLIM